MQRKVEFRGKRRSDGKWLYGYLYEGYVGKKKVLCIDEWDVDPKTVGQLTGLKDKNRTPIWEGDLVKTDRRTYSIDWYGMAAQWYLFTTYANDEGNHMHSVGSPERDWRWLNGGADISWIGRSYPDTTPLEVIGNVHDRAESR